MRDATRRTLSFFKPLLFCGAAVLSLSPSLKAVAQNAEPPQPSYKITVVPLAAGAQTMSWPLAFNDAGQMVTSSYLNGQNYGFRVSRYGSDGLKDIGLLRNDSHRGAFFINRSGQVAGRLNFGAENSYDTRAIFFDGQNTLDLGTLGGVRSYGTALNDLGQVVGTSETGVDYNRGAFLSNGGAVMQALNVGGISSDARGINNSGDIVGSYDTSTSPTHGERHAYAIRNGVFVDLGKLNGVESWATAINDAGQIIGGVRFPNYSSRAFRYQNGTMSDLGTLGGTNSEASDINASGEVVGQSGTTFQGRWGLVSHAFKVGGDGVMRDLGSLTGNAGESSAVDINDNGQIVGWSYNWNYEQSGFVYRDGQMHDLNYAIDWRSGWRVTNAEFINNSGQIAATGRDANGNTRALLLSPNARPVTNDDTMTVVQDSVDNVLRVLDNDTDADGDALQLEEYLWASNGQVRRSEDNKTVLYTPNAGFVGTDIVRYAMSDGVAWVQGFATVTVTPNANGIVADAQSVETDEDVAKTITLTAQAPAPQTIDSYVVTTPPNFGTLTGTAPDLVYTPSANYNGTDSFAFRAFVGTTGSNIATVSIDVKSVNDAPTSSTQSVTLDEDTTKSITLSGTDVDGDSLMYSIVTPPTKGVFSGSAPNLIYTPNANYNGSDSFTFKANDGTADSAPAVVSIAVAPVNDPPVAEAQSVSTAEDTPISITLSGTDIDGDTLSYRLRTYPRNGKLSNPEATTPATFIYTPNADWGGTDSFTFVAHDGKAQSAEVTVSIRVTAVNDAPRADSQTVEANEDQSKYIPVWVWDDSYPLTYSVVTPPAHGVVSGTFPNLYYISNKDYSGPDFFTFKANDGTFDSNVARVSINVMPINDAPVANAQNVSTDEDSATDIVLSGSDAEGSPLSYIVVSSPARGTLSGVAPNLTYTPNANLNGTDSFTFKVRDGALDSPTATVSIGVNAVNDAPVAQSQSVTTDEDRSVSITLNANDPDRTPLNYWIVSSPAHGRVNFLFNQGLQSYWSYTPDANYFGADSFQFKANDGMVDSNVATVSVSVAPLPDTPVANSQVLNLNEDSALSLTLTGTDSDGDFLTFTLTTQPTHGTLSGVMPNLTYTPAANYNGADNFYFTASDGAATSTSAVVVFNIARVNDAPTTTDDAATVDQDSGATTINVLANDTDVDGDTLAIRSFTQPANGVVRSTTGGLTYQPKASFYGTDAFSYTVQDSVFANALISTATVRVTVTHINHAPNSSTQSVTTNEDTAKNIVLAATDVDGDALTFAIVTPPGKGTLSGSGANRTYTPNANFNGSDSFSFKANDGALDSNVSVVNIAVTPVNDAPTSSTQSVTTSEDTAKNITLVASDIDGGALTYSVVIPPTKGTLSGTAPNLVYTPIANANGVDSFTFKANDGTLDSNVSTVSIAIVPVNDAPISSTQSVTTAEDVARIIVLAATDIDGDALSYSIVAAPTKGVLSGGMSSLTYTPNANFNGSDSFTFKANDGALDSNTSSVSIAVTPVNDAPISTGQSVTTPQATAKNITLSGSDVDGDALTYAIVSAPANGTLSGSGANRVYTPNAGFSGSDSFTFKASDSALSSNVATVGISVTPVVAASNFVVTYKVTSQWSNGFNADVTIKNNGPEVKGWTLTWAFANGQVVSNMWNATSSQSGANVSAKDAGWNKTIPTGGTASFGFTASSGAVNGKPTSFKLNGQTCTIAP